MKNKININISKDTPAEIITTLCAAIKTQAKEPKHKQPLYALSEDIEKLHKRYEELFKQVKNSLNLSADQIEKECATLSRKYDFELEELSQMRKVDYDKRQAEINARAAEETPWRRGWWWRLIFQPLTNRAQNIIEKRAELKANIAHTAAEKEIENDCNKLLSENDEQQSKRKLKRQMREKLKKVIETADNADVQEAFNEPQSDVQELPQDNKQLQGQLSIDGIQSQTNARRPRPPRSCRKP